MPARKQKPITSVEEGDDTQEATTMDETPVNEEAEETNNNNTSDNEEENNEDGDDDVDDDDEDEEEEDGDDEQAPNEGGFEITENIDDTNYYEKFEQQVLEEMKQRKQKKSVAPELLYSDLSLEQYANMKVKFVKPFDYAALRAKQRSRGVIYVQKPFIINQMDHRFSNENNVRQYFSDYGTQITRIQPALEGNNHNILTGWYIEFDRRSLAKRIALTMNGSPISPNDSRTLSVKYMPNFKWSEYVESKFCFCCELFCHNYD